jgi:hypothetical protein
MDFAWSKGVGGGGEVPRDKAQQGSPAEVPLRCGQSSLPRYLLKDAFKFVCVKESASASFGFLGGKIDYFFTNDSALGLGLLFGSLNDAPVPSNESLLSLGFLSGQTTDLVEVASIPVEESPTSLGFESGLIFNIVETEDVGSEESPTLLGFQEGTLSTVIFVAPDADEESPVSLGFLTGAQVQVAFSVSSTENNSQSIGFLSGSLA